MTPKVPRLLVVSSHPAQTHVDLYRRLAQSTGVDVVVLFARDTTGGFTDREFGIPIAWDVDLTAGYASEFLTSGSSWSFRAGDSKDSRLEVPTLRALIETWKRIRRLRPDVVLLAGHGSPWYVFVWIVCRMLRIPYILRGEGVVQGPPSSVRSWLSRRLARGFVRRAAVFCHIGVANFYFGIANGARKFSFSPYCIDSGRFGLTKLSSTARQRRLAEIGLDPAVPVVVFSGKLQSWKRPQDVVRAIALATLPVQGIVIGDGPMLEELQSLASESGANVHFAGFVNQMEIPAWYALGEVIVLPSGVGGDTWGLAINEALALGLTPVVSAAVPSWPDLAWTEGYVFPVADVERLAECIVGALERRASPAHHEALRQLVLRYSIEEAAKGIESAVRQAVQGPRASERR